MKCINCGMENADSSRICVYCNQILPSRNRQDDETMQSPFSKIKIEGGPGETLETAFIIKGAPDSSIGVPVEYFILHCFLGQKGKDWVFKDQTLHKTGGRAYDFMHVELSDGSKKTVYFDITEFYYGNKPATTVIQRQPKGGKLMSTKINLNLFKIGDEEYTIREWLYHHALKKELLELLLLVVGIFSIGVLGILIWVNWK